MKKSKFTEQQIAFALQQAEGAVSFEAGRDHHERFRRSSEGRTYVLPRNGPQFDVQITAE